MVVTRDQGVGNWGDVVNGINLQLVDKFWRSNAQYNDYINNSEL